MSAEKENNGKLEKLFRHYSSLMFYVAIEILHNEQDAEDAVLAALWKIFQNMEKIGELDCPKTKRFVVIVSERQAIDLYRKNARRKTVNMDDLEEFPERNAFPCGLVVCYGSLAGRRDDTGSSDCDVFFRNL